MFCSSCGKQLSDGSKFCNFCGATQTIVADAVVTPNATPVSAPIIKPVSEEYKDLGLRLEKAADVLDTLLDLEKTLKEEMFMEHL